MVIPISSVKMNRGNTNKIKIGTSGYSYEDWVGVLYEKQESKLKKYSSVFTLVEIDSTFYSEPKPEVVRYWVTATPLGFTFTAKLPREITHKRKLDPRRGAIKEFTRFLELLKPLISSNKLGCLVAQLPPSFTYSDVGYLESFLKEVPRDIRLAIEFRNPSLLRDDVYRILERYEAAFVIVDEPLLPPEIVITTDFSYIRWHGRGKAPWYNYHYSIDELKEWVPKVIDVAEKTEIVYGLFNNHFYGYAVHNALQMLMLLRIANQYQREILRKLDEYFLRRETGVRPPIKEKKPVLLCALNVKELLEYLMDKQRYRRMFDINKADIKIIESSNKMIKAKVKDYIIIIDIDKRTILHDCPDWSRVLVAKQFCKHVGRVFLALRPELAKSILCDIIENKDNWNFKPLTQC
mgnify:CR=1 FL=1